MVSTRKSSASLRRASSASDLSQVSRKAKQVKQESVVKTRDALQHTKNFALGLSRRLTLLRELHLADYLTVANGFCGSLSIFNAGQYMLTDERCYMWIALTLPLLGFVFDAFDGKVARARRTSSELGQELDSLSDSISFGVAPALIGFSLGLRTPLDVVILSFFIVCGIARLARFNATINTIPKDKKGQSLYFEGLPIPTSLAIVFLLAYSFGAHHSIPLGTINWTSTEYGEIHLFSLLYLFWGLAMTSKNLRVPKF